MFALRLIYKNLLLLPIYEIVALGPLYPYADASSYLFASYEDTWGYSRGLAFVILEIAMKAPQQGLKMFMVTLKFREVSILDDGEYVNFD